MPRYCRPSSWAAAAISSSELRRHSRWCGNGTCRGDFSASIRRGSFPAAAVSNSPQFSAQLRGCNRGRARDTIRFRHGSSELFASSSFFGRDAALRASGQPARRPYLGFSLAETIFVHVQPRCRARLRTTNVVLFAPGKIIERERIFRRRHHPQIALNPGTQAHARLSSVLARRSFSYFDKGC